MQQTIRGARSRAIQRLSRGYQKAGVLNEVDERIIQEIHPDAVAAIQDLLALTNTLGDIALYAASGKVSIRSEE